MFVFAKYKELLGVVQNISKAIILSLGSVWTVYGFLDTVVEIFKANLESYSAASIKMNLF